MANSYLTNNYSQIMSYRYDTNLISKVEDILKKGESSSFYGKLIGGTLKEEV